ncbi:MAG: T9SS type A sorting domain-containing protein [Bacteroidetes bacterium]|nr:MAG: T9SS type A sorting domain-containing protein [Bacteroidota bacterium]
MKHYFLIVVLLLCSVLTAQAQVTNLFVNGSDTNFTFESGSAVSWQYNVNPAGATANGELWYDVNGNGVIDSLVDKARFIFTQTDGQGGNDGPPDLDDTANGVITFTQPVGLAPGNWVLKISQGGSSLSVKGTITALTSVAHTISGHVTPPSGESAQYIFMQIEPNSGGDGNKFWEAITDANGDYTIEINADTSGNPWRVRFADQYNPFPGLVPIPSEYTVTITGNHSGFDFSFGAASAKVVGYLWDDLGNPLTNFGVWLGRHSDTSNFDWNTQTDGSGYFEFGLAADELSNADFTLGSSFDNNSSTHAYLAANTTIHGIQLNDSLYFNLVAYSVNSTIEGQVLINGNPPGFTIEIQGMVQDSGWTSTWADSLTGNFSLEVSNKLYNYQLSPSNLPPEYFSGNVTAHAGDTGVMINITVTGVNEREPGVPSAFSLGQNYPNPFNPTTVIDYDIPATSHVQISVYNILGKEVLSIVNQEQSAGKYRATVDASTLPSGMYFYRLTAGNFSQTKKFVVMK